MRIGIVLGCGLGNVLFQVAAAAAIADRMGAEGILVASYRPEHQTVSHGHFLRGLEWPEDPDAVVDAAVLYADDMGSDAYDVFARRAEEVGALLRAGRVSGTQAHDPGGPLLILVGMFQNPRYFWDRRDAIRERFGPTPEDRARILAGPYGDALRRGAVFVHVRRGDYVGSGFDIGLVEHGYYGRALAALMAGAGEVPAPILVCSDDIAWCRGQAALAGLGPRVEWVDGLDEVDTLFLMAMCTHGGVCANSTYSWWGAFLGPGRGCWPAAYRYDQYAFPGLMAVE